MLHIRGYRATTGNIDLPCKLVDCKTGDVIECVPGETPSWKQQLQFRDRLKDWTEWQD